MALSTSSFARSFKLGRNVTVSGDCYWLLNYYNPALNTTTFQQEWSFTQSVIDSGNNVISIGFSYTDVGYLAFLTKTSPNGTLIFSKTFIHPDGYITRGVSVAIDNSDNIYVTLSDDNELTPRSVNGYILKLSSNGSSIIWQTKYTLDATINNSTDFSLNKMVVDSNNNVYVGLTLERGVSVYSQAGLLKFNSSGVLQWQRIINSPSDGISYLHKLGIGPDNNPVIGYRYPEGPAPPGVGPIGFSDPGLVKFDSDGNILWHVELDYTSGFFYLDESYLYIDSNNDIYISASGLNFLIKISSSGVKISEQRFTGSTEAYLNYPAIMGDDEGNFYLASDFFPGVFILKLDSSLNIIWQKSLTFSDSSYRPSPGLYTGCESNILRVKNNALYYTGSLRVNNFGSGELYTGMITKFPLDSSLDGTYPFTSLSGTFTYTATTNWSINSTNTIIVTASSRVFASTGGTVSSSSFTISDFTAYNYPSVIACAAIAPPGPPFPPTQLWYALYGDMPTNNNDQSGSSVTYDSEGSLYFVGTAIIESTYLIESAVIGKYDKYGTLIWQKTISLNEASTGNYFNGCKGSTVAVDSNDYVYFGTESYTDNGGQRWTTIFKFDENGNLIYQKKISSDVIDVIFDMAIDSGNNLIFTMDHGNLPTNTIKTRVVKLDSSGNLLWCKDFESQFSPYIYYSETRITTDSSNNIYCVGKVLGNLMLSKIDSSGTLIWSKLYSLGVYNREQEIVVDSSNNIYIAMGSAAITPSGGSILYKLDSSGNILWEKSFAEVYDIFGLSIDSSQNIYVSGISDFLPDISDTYVIFKFDSSGNLEWQRYFDSSEQTDYKDDIGNMLAIYNDKYSIIGWNYPTEITVYNKELIIAQFNTDGSNTGTFGLYIYGIATINISATTGVVSSSGTPTITAATPTITTDTLLISTGSYSTTTYPME